MRLAIALLVAGCSSQLPGPVSRPDDVRDRYIAEWAAARWAELGLDPIGDCPLPRIVWPASDETAQQICRGAAECYASVRPGPVSTERVPVIVIHHAYPRWFWVHGLLHRFQHCAGLPQDHEPDSVWGPDAPDDWGGLLRELEDKAR